MPRKGYKSKTQQAAEILGDGSLELWVPALLSVEEVARALGPELKLDNALAILAKIAGKQRNVEMQKYRGMEFRNYERYGYVSLHSNTLKHLGGKNYADYTEALKRAGIIQVYQYDDKEYNPAPGLFGPDEPKVKVSRRSVGAYESRGDFKYTKGYKILHNWFPEGETYHRYRSIRYTDPTVILKLIASRSKVAQNLTDHSRKRLAEMTNHLVAKSDPDFADKVVEGWYHTHQERIKQDPKLKPLKINDMHPQDAVLYMRDLKEDGCWITDYDDYGGRFHHSIGVMDSRMRCFYGSWSIDFKNSQFALLALCIENPQIALKIVTEKEGDDYEEMRFAINQLTAARQKYEDVRQFVRQAKAGTLYEWVAASLGYFGADGKPDRKRAKKLMFGVMFSGTLERYKQKLELQPVIGDLLEVCSYINDPRGVTNVLIDEATESLKWTKAKQRRIQEGKMSTLPKMLQRFESRMMIDRFTLVAANSMQGIGDFTTVHDSVLCNKKDAEVLESILRQVFAHTELPMPQVESKELTFDYPG
ncbi:hypothetical protein I0P70_13670 [Pontibacter sp. FD36]|uniref:hypothetical protein n=1 Tax=Pontibacter sp. FD36 TaxID=2789860 RepID=UPI0018A9D469|nr:hypothetical protein [Pontibacter sp. FD36]MBF8964298.1 hypothetical protein [Pontibacter sp. FD36]